MHRNGIAIINESQKDAYSENFIKIRPQTAKLGVGTVPRPKLNFCCTILAEIGRFGILNVTLRFNTKVQTALQKAA